LLASAAAPSQPARTIAFTNVTVIDGTGAPPRRAATVVVRGDRIADVTTAGAASGADVIDGTGRFMIPGLWDMHVHLTNTTELAGPAFIANGVTGVRDCGGELEVIDWIRHRFESGTIAGPRVFRAGPFVDGLKPGVADRIVIGTGEEGRRVVTFLKPRGIDFIKVHNGAAAEAYFAMLAEARRQGIPVVGHIPLSVDPAKAIEAGHHSVEHIVSLFEGPVAQKVKEGKSQEQALSEFTDDAATVLLKLMVKNGTWFDPTLIAYWTRSYQWDVRAKPDPLRKYAASTLQAYWKTFRELPDEPGVRALLAQAYTRFVELVRMAHRERVRLLVGTDVAATYLIPGFSVHDELEKLVEAGLSPSDVIVAATRNAADSLGRLGDLGTIEKGKRADLVLLDANPLDDIANTRRIAAVVANGRLYRGTELTALLERVAADAPNR
jgi:imidazolonepropionase-like amidohydrolase